MQALPPETGRLVRETIAVVIPCYQAANSIGEVLDRIGPEVAAIYCVDDASSDSTVSAIKAAARSDPRIHLVCRSANGGVGAATIDGYRAALADRCSLLVKLDADGQMDPSLIRNLTEPIASGKADYVKGNRFFSVETVRRMPRVRLVGNAGISFLAKMSTGYWQVFDPTNGFTALHANVARALPLHKLHERYFFESDLLFRLNTLRAVVAELPMDASYGMEESHLSETHALLAFPFLHLRNSVKRLIYSYFLRNFSIASANLIVGLLMLVFATAFGVSAWTSSIASGTPATAGTVMLSALPFLIGVQLVLSFVAYDMTMVPDRPIHERLPSAPVDQRTENDIRSND